MKEIDKIKKILKKFSVTEAYLYGSFLENPEHANDIDIGISLDDDSDFFKLYAVLEDKISKPVDLIDIKYKNLFNKLVKRDGLKICG